MGSIEEETSVTPPSQAKVRPQLDLVPWDPDSDEHVQRMLVQRIACGWKKEKVESWRQPQRDGKMGLHWIVLSHKEPTKQAQLAAHISSNPSESAPLTDTASSVHGKPRQASSATRSFIPVGHISLDSESVEPLIADPTKGILGISTFYISRALQNGGLGRAAMGAIEHMATSEPICARAICLDTGAREVMLDLEAYKRRGQEAPRIPTQDWYASQGYEVFARREEGYLDVAPNGEERIVPCVFMRKQIV